MGSRVFLFGGTSPYSGPQLYFTPEQLQLLPQQEEVVILTIVCSLYS